MLYFAQIDNAWNFRIECDDLHIIFTRHNFVSLYIYDTKKEKYLNKSIDEILIPGHEITVNDFLYNFLQNYIQIAAYFSRTSGRDCYCILCENISIYSNDSKIHRYLQTIFTYAKKTSLCKFVFNVEHLEHFISSNYHKFQDCIRKVTMKNPGMSIVSAHPGG